MTDAIRWEQRGIEARDAGRHAEAVDYFTEAVACGNRPLSWLGLAMSQIDLHRPEEAIVSLRHAQALSPKSGVIAHLLAALNGEKTEQAPASFVNWLFDGYAAGFDNHLARLGYQGPDMLRQLAVRADWAADRNRNILDLGCGTGLSGQPFVPYAARLDGVDLSDGMLEQASRRGIYTELYRGEAHVALGALPAESYDIVIAADVLIYIGNLAKLFPLVSRCLKPGGSFLFTVEICDADFVLSPTGRYKHSDAYLRECAVGLFDIADSIDGTIRVESGLFTPARAYRLTRI